VDLIESRDTVTLRCCGPGQPQDAFRIVFRKSKSCLEYDKYLEHAGLPLGKPDIMVVICIHCQNEIMITNSEGQIHPSFDGLRDAMNVFRKAYS
jgi:hypothetical protein